MFVFMVIIKMGMNELSVMFYSKCNYNPNYKKLNMKRSKKLLLISEDIW